jgi:hypothetical protein
MNSDASLKTYEFVLMFSHFKIFPAPATGALRVGAPEVTQHNNHKNEEQ